MAENNEKISSQVPRAQDDPEIQFKMIRMKLGEIGNSERLAFLLDQPLKRLVYY